jgi:hypothetical protein
VSDGGGTGHNILPPACREFITQGEVRSLGILLLGETQRFHRVKRHRSPIKEGLVAIAGREWLSHRYRSQLLRGLEGLAVR